MLSGVQWTCTFLVLVIVGAAHADNTTSRLSCEDARLRCAYRTGCGAALQQYITSCAADLREDVTSCPETCQHALIALTSTDEGKELMTCDCAKEDSMCEKSKQRAEICRSSVTAVMNRTRVSCRIATWICNADALCSTALLYYNEYCKSMFNGRKCSHRCRNSIAILKRQEKADKLNTCQCDGEEDYDCKGIHRNMDILCFGKNHNEYHEVKKIFSDETNTNEVSETGDNICAGGTRTFISRTELLFGLILFLLISKD